MDLSPEEGKCFDSPLKRMQWLNVYGNIRNVQEHLMAVMNLVILRGGVESLELFGLAEMLLGYAISLLPFPHVMSSTFNFRNIQMLNFPPLIKAET